MCHFRLLWDNFCVILIPRRNYFLLKPQIVTESVVALTYSLILIPQSGFSEKNDRSCAKSYVNLSLNNYFLKSEEKSCQNVKLGMCWTSAFHLSDFIYEISSGKAPYHILLDRMVCIKLLKNQQLLKRRKFKLLRKTMAMCFPLTIIENLFSKDIVLYTHMYIYMKIPNTYSL